MPHVGAAGTPSNTLQLVAYRGLVLTQYRIKILKGEQDVEDSEQVQTEGMSLRPHALSHTISGIIVEKLTAKKINPYD